MMRMRIYGGFSFGVVIGVCGVLIVDWLLWLFCDVGVWLVT